VSRSAFDDARVLAARGDSDGALAALDALLGETREDVAALVLKAQVLLEAGAAAAALEVADRAASLAPRSAEAANTLARCLHALERDEEALTAAERARGLLAEGDNGLFAGPVYLTLVWCLRSLRRYREALDAAEQGLSRTPDAILAQWASDVEEELAHRQREEC
jgi:tetratricopeptide (TPR) repeat protein